MEEKVLRIISIYGKQEFSRKIKGLPREIYDEYNLDKSKYYIDEIKSNDLRIGNQEIFEYKTLRYMDCDIDRFEIIEFEEILDNKELLSLYKKRPLDIFINDRVLNNRDIIIEIVKEYPTLLYTLIKEKYRKYFSCVGIGTMLIMNKIYPIKNIDKKLIEEAFKSDKYKLEYIYHFVTNSPAISYSFMYSEGYDKEEKEVMEIMLPYLYKFFDDERFVFNILCMVSNESDIVCIQDAIEQFGDENEAIEGLLSAKKQKLETEEEILKQEIDNLKNSAKKENDLIGYLENIITYLLNNNYRKKVNEYEIIKLISPELLENKQFLIICAKKGFGLSKYSNKLKGDRDVIYQEIKTHCFPVCFLDKELQNDQNYILKLRCICDRVLFYVDPLLLNDYEFMINYIKSFSIDKYFILGEQLMKNQDFFYEAIQYDNYIMAYCSFELRENAIFMQKMIALNGYCIHFIGSGLKNNKNFILSLLFKYKSF